VLFLFEDDGGFALGAYGDKVSQTPHLDALAARGTVFDQAYTSVSSCSPSRASLLTGLPTHQNGQFGLLNCNFYSFPGIQALPNILTASGVRTGIIGKYHVAAGSTSPGSAYNFSWGNSAAGPGGCQAGASDSCPDTDYNTVSRNITYMRAQADSFLQWAQGDPFFFYVGFGDSHRCSGEQGAFCENYGRDKSGASTIPDWVPFVPEPSSVQLPFWVQDTPIARQDYANMLTAKSRMDQGVGLLLKSLEASGRANDTLVVYFAGEWV
jgi:N-sulfoglucosamine sulfohydrolase